MASSNPPACAQLIPQNNVFGAFGAVVGYIGAEAATHDIFERLLWPQRFYSGLTFLEMLQVAFSVPMGGPLHKVALHTLDVLFKNGLFKGAHQGHLLATSFFREDAGTYTARSTDASLKLHTEPLRNCIWARALSYIPMPVLENQSGPPSKENLEKGSEHPERCRAKISVSHLTVSKATSVDKASNLPFVSESVNTIGPMAFTAICVSESAAICMAAGVALAFHSWWSLLWLIPLSLKLVSAALCLSREPLVKAVSAADDDEPTQDFEIDAAASHGSFMLLTGPSALVLQFFRHYGHPIRNRFREVTQLFIIVAYTCLFPIGLLCSVIWMPLPIQYAWLCYQVYVVLVMHVARYTYLGTWWTTEARIAAKLGKVDGGRCILFGQERNGLSTIKVTLDVTYHSRYQRGKAHLEQLLGRHANEI